MAVTSRELQLDLRDPIPFLRDDGVTARAWGDIAVPWYLRLLGWFLRGMPVPELVATVPDGNRRFARTRGLPDYEGHVMGLGVLEKVMAAAPVLGVKRLINFIFSLNNFVRDEEEKFNLFSQLLSVADSVCENPEFYKRKGCHVKFIGELEMFPRKLSRKMAKADLITLENRGGLELISCVAYSARNEASKLTLKLCQAVKKGILEPRDITEELIHNYQGMEVASEVDLLIRTSGEQRLSDFLLWQTGYSLIHFERKLYPDLGLWDIIKVIFHFLATYKVLQRVKTRHRIKDVQCSSDAAQAERQQTFLSMVRQERIDYLKLLARDDV